MDSEIEIDDFQTEVLPDEKVVGFDIPMSNTVPVEICDALDEAPADLADVGRKSTRSDLDIVYDRVHFWENCPRPGLHFERIQQRDNVLGLGLKVIKNFEDVKLVR